MAEICRLLGIEETALAPLWVEIESCWKKKGARLVNERQERERKIADEKAKQQSDKGKLGAKARWPKDSQRHSQGISQAKPKVCPTDGPIQSQSHKEHLRSPPPPVAMNGFAAFWQAYPRKKSKGQAEKAWRTLRPDEQLQAAILAGVERAKTSADWTKKGGEYVPHPATWLNAKGWEDEVEAAADAYDDLPEGRTCSACGGVHEWRAGKRLEPCPKEPA
jgi:hypothetical protein